MVHVEFTVLHEAPELHLVHDKRVVGALLVTKATVEIVDLPQNADVTHDYTQCLERNSQIMVN